MRVTIIPFDKIVAVDGYAVGDIDFSGFDPDIHAVQFLDGKGHIEYKNRPQEEITNIFRFDHLLNQHRDKKDFIEKRKVDPYYGMPAEERLSTMKEDYHLRANREFDGDSKKPVSTPYGSFNGGEGSAMSIKGAIELTEELEESVVILTDFENEPKQLTPHEAREVLVVIAKDFRNKFYLKQQKKVVIKKATDPKQIKALFGEE